jgi:hypothetical protein
LVNFANRPPKRSGSQANRVTLTKCSRCNNSSGDVFSRGLRQASIVKRLAGSFQSFNHRRNQLRLERSRLHE